MKTLLVLLALSMLARAGDLYVYERKPDEPSGVHHGTVSGPPLNADKKMSVLIMIYGRDAIQAAQMYGRGLVLNHYPFAACKQMIIDRATELYAGHPQMIRWFEQDCAAAYDAEVRAEKAGAAATPTPETLSPDDDLKKEAEGLKNLIGGHQ